MVPSLQSATMTRKLGDRMQGRRVDLALSGQNIDRSVIGEMPEAEVEAMAEVAYGPSS
jgi:hypothetical protein